MPDRFSATPAGPDEALVQRTHWLVDIFHDRRHALFIASDCPIAEAISRLGGAHDLTRTLSRLAEIESPAYPGLRAPDKIDLPTCPPASAQLP